MDEQTMKDYIEDLLTERDTMLERNNRMMIRIHELEAEVKRLEQQLARHV